MRSADVILNVVIVIVLLLAIRYPGYFKDWGIGKGGQQPYEDNSPAYFYVRVGAAFALCLVVIFDLYLLMCFMGLDTILTNLVSSFIDESKTPVSENKIVGSFVTVSLINCFWALWYIRLWWEKKRDFKVFVQIMLICSFPFCLLTPMIMKVSFFWQQFCIVVNAIIFAGIMMIRWIEK